MAKEALKMVTTTLLLIGLCGLCWLITIKAILIRSFKNSTVGLFYNYLVAIMMSVNLIFILPYLCLLLIRSYQNNFLNQCLLLVTVTDFLSTVGLMFFCLYSRKTSKRKCSQDVQFLLVLGAATKNGKVSKILASRLKRTISCWQKNQTAKIIVSGGPKHSQLPEAEIMAKYLVSHDIPKDSIIIENAARNTRQNILFSSRLINDENVTVITSDFHVLRSYLYAKALRLNWQFLGTPTPIKYRPLTFVRDYLGIIRDHRWQAVTTLIITIIIVELL